ncbi:MAG: hypothetical protein UEP57_08215 [Oscillospiraceae bacterium]|nr:hypothetical protein [Oscillospiraceae bacterium]
MENKNIDLIELARKMKEDAIQHARWMNDQYVAGDVERNHTNYGTMTQALRVLNLLGHEASNATWGQANLLICESITIDNVVVFKR